MRHIFFAVLILLLGDMGQAQASKQKSSVTVAANPVISSTIISASSSVALSGRTVTGRPANLDPRIPWLEDLGMAQSGGPEPLVKMEEIVLPEKGSLHSVITVEKDIVVGIGTKIVRITSAGHVVWSRSLTDPNPGQWILVGDKQSIYAVPVNAHYEGARIYIFNYDGVIVGATPWPLAPNGRDWVASVIEKKGFIVADVGRGRRIYAHIDPKSSNNPDDIVTVGDLFFVGRGGEQNREYLRGNLLIDMKQRNMKYLHDQYKAKIGIYRWVGRRIVLSQLPFFGSPESPGHSRPNAAIDPIAIEYLGDDDSCIVVHRLINVRGRTRGEYNSTEKYGAENSWMISEHRFDGSLRSYLILPNNSSHFLSDDAVYIPDGDKVVRWMHVK